MPSTLLVYVTSLIRQHVSTSLRHLKDWFKIHKRDCIQLLLRLELKFQFYRSLKIHVAVSVTLYKIGKCKS